jgi:hypothetical protein
MLNQSISGTEKITYHNNSPDVLKYLWVQLDQNLYEKESNTGKTSNNSITDSVAAKTMAGQLSLYDFAGGYKIASIKDAAGNPLKHTINKTMMRVDLPQPL